uniref:Anti-Mullerian hormone n=1 Tax=Xenopus laevis TaxID=8355 RepID=U6C7D3_XENLA|nr:anti-Mullerian hormone [Xenopus laevis]
MLPMLFFSYTGMGIARLRWWLFLLPMMRHTLSSKSDTREAQEDFKAMVLTKPLSQSSQLVRHEVDTEELDKPMCGLSVPSWGKWETQGVVRGYDSAFLDAVQRGSWEADDLKVFGLCPGEKHQAALGVLKSFADLLVEPQGKNLLVLHMEKVDWEAGTSLHFKGTSKEHVTAHLQHRHLQLLVFHLDTHESYRDQHGSKILVTGGGVQAEQVACVSLNTRYLVMRVGGNVKNHPSGDLMLHLSVHMKGLSNGVSLTTVEVEKLLFGTDKKCLTKMTPVLFMVIGGTSQDAPASFLSQAENLRTSFSTHINSATVAEKKDGFLEMISQFSVLLLNSNGKAASTIKLPLDPNDHSVGDLYPQLFNVTDVEALEWLVDSNDPLVFLFLSGNKFLQGTKVLQEKLAGKLLDKMTDKLQEVLEDMEELLSNKDHAQILRHLLHSCHGSYNVSYLPSEAENISQVGESQNRKLHSLMLLKVLQTIRSYWQDQKKLSRRNRGTGTKPYCRLQELTISLKPFAEYKDVLLPEEININNCVGPCRFPQTTQNDYQTHVILLIQLQERSLSSLARPPCCVPVRYEEQWLMVVDGNGIRIQSYPNMVAKECGCR